jgi:hypothetical protein
LFSISYPSYIETWVPITSNVTFLIGPPKGSNYSLTVTYISYFGNPTSNVIINKNFSENTTQIIGEFEKSGFYQGYFYEKNYDTAYNIWTYVYESKIYK